MQKNKVNGHKKKKPLPANTEAQWKQWKHLDCNG